MQCFSRAWAVLKRFDVGGQSGHKNHDGQMLPRLSSPMKPLVLPDIETSGVSIPSQDAADVVKRWLQESVDSNAESPLDDGVSTAQLSSGVAGLCGMASKTSIAFGEVMRWFVSRDMMISLTLSLVRPDIHVPFSR